MLQLHYLSIYHKLMENHNPDTNNTLSITTILVIFLMTVINQIFVISLIAILLKKVRILFRSSAKKYYFFVIFYIVSKVILTIIVDYQIINEIPDNFKNLDSITIEKVFKNTMAFADASIIELFLVSFEYYLAISFSILSSPRTQKFIKVLIRFVQLITFFAMIIPIVLFNIKVINYTLLNTFMTVLNCLTVGAFITAFFFMNFKMTGVMLQRKTSFSIKKLYQLLLLLLLSRIIMGSVEILVLVNLSNGNFEDFITLIEQSQGQFVTLALCFIIYLLVVLVTEGIPLIVSLRQSTILAFLSYNVIRKQSIISSEDYSEENIREDLLGNFQDNFEDESLGKSNEHPQSLIISSIDDIHSVDKVIEKPSFKMFKGKFHGIEYFVRQIPNISSYIIQQTIKEIDLISKNEIKCINKLQILKKNQNIYLIEKFLKQTLHHKMPTLKTYCDKINVCISIAEALKKLHQKNYGHGSLSPKNIMFDEDSCVYFTGYGLQSLRKYMSLTSQYTNITLYTAVELLGTKRQKVISKPSPPADIYSFGIIIYELFSENTKYRLLEINEIREKFGKQNSRPKIPDNVPEPFIKLMRKCWQENPEDRVDINWIIDYLKKNIDTP